MLYFAAAVAVVLAQNTSTPTGLTLEPTIQSIGIVGSYAGDDDQDAVAWIEYIDNAVRFRGPAAVRLSGRRWAASLFELQPATAYTIALWIDDPDNTGPVSISSPTQTRNSTPPSPTGTEWWVDVNTGSDTNPGTSARPFRTIQRGTDAAQPGDRVRVRPGIYREQVLPPRGGTAGNPIWITAEGSPTTLDGSDPAIATAPWTNAGGALWWTPFNGESIYAAVDDARIYDYQSLADLQAENGNVGVPGAIAGGFFVDRTASRLYLITPAHDDPAAHQIHVAVLPSAFLLDGLTDVVIQGFEIRYYGREGAYGSVGIDLRDTARAWVRSNAIHHLGEGVRVRRPLASQNVIEHNTIRDTSVYGWPWASVKNYHSAGTGVVIRDGHGNVVRCNDLEGQFNGIYSGAFGDANEEIARDTEVYENRLRFHGDDGLELEGAQRNVRYFRNRIRDVYNAISIAPIEVGPAYLHRTAISGYREHAVKANNATYGWVFLYHTTAEPQSGTLAPGAQAMAPPIPFGSMTLRNNIWEANHYVFEYEPTSLLTPIDWDRDGLWTNDSERAGRFVKWFNVRYADLAALVAGTSIEANATQARPVYEGSHAGDYRLTVGHSFVDAGEVIAGVNDRFVAGSAPDFGANERPLADLTGCGAWTFTSLLLRNAEWPTASKAEIFTGNPPGCGRIFDPGCADFKPPGISLDPWGVDCVRSVIPPRDDDVYLSAITCPLIEPDASIATDATRPLVFYQLDRTPSVCNSLRLVKDGPGGLRIDCD